MQTSNYILRVLLYQLNHETDQVLETKSEHLFQHPGNKSFIEVHYQQLGQQGFPNPILARNDNQESDCSLVPPYVLDKSLCNSLCEGLQSTCENSLGLLRQDILNLKDLQQIEKVSTLWQHWVSFANTQGNEGYQALFPRLVSESSIPLR